MPGRIGLINMASSMKSSGKVAGMSSRRVSRSAGEESKAAAENVKVVSSLAVSHAAVSKLAGPRPQFFHASCRRKQKYGL